MMNDHKSYVDQALNWISRQSSHRPQVGVLTGTGLGKLADCLVAPLEFAYSAIPHFPVSTAPSHAGRMLLGEVGGVEVVLFQGRLHLYEGYSPCQVTFPVRIMQGLGVRQVIISNAAGGVNTTFSPGDIMAIVDHINLTGTNPLVGPNVTEWGVRFPDMVHAYTPQLRILADQCAETLGIPLCEGVYAGLLGPSLETPAEIRLLQRLAADAVGFSTVQEAIAAVHAGMQVLGLSIITNIHQPDAPHPATIEEILAVAEAAASRLERLIAALLARLANNQL
jgi:purine-nucleoside phosphorylase